MVTGHSLLCEKDGIEVFFSGQGNFP